MSRWRDGEAERPEMGIVTPLDREADGADEGNEALSLQSTDNVPGTGSAGTVKLRPRSFIAVAAMLAIAQGGNKSVPLREVAAAIGVSESYLEQVYSGLRRSGLIRSFRGPGGGYRLAKPGTGISVLDIVMAVERGAIASRKKPGGGPRSARRAHASYLREQLEGFQYLLLLHMSLADVASASLDRNPFLKWLFETLHRKATEHGQAGALTGAKLTATPDPAIHLPSPGISDPGRPPVPHLRD
jgi:Rrf2 family iron-sulfur cluster assembly transcriptional regulator